MKKASNFFTGTNESELEMLSYITIEWNPDRYIQMNYTRDLLVNITLDLVMVPVQ